MRTRILFLMQLPPPVHGASLINSYIQESDQINSSFNCQFIDTSPGKSLANLGGLNIGKIYKAFCIYLKILWAVVTFRPSLCYFTLSPRGLAFYKDALIVCILKIFRVKRVFHLHGKGITQLIESGFKKKLYQFTFKGAHVIHLSESLFYDVEPIADKSQQLFSLGNGVPDTAVESQRFEEKEDTFPVFLHLTNFIPEKGTLDLIEAVNKLPETYRGRFKVILVGKFRDENFKKQVEEAIAKKFGDSIALNGPAYHEDKITYLNQANIFVHPTRHDCFPLVLLEAMCHSMAVISTHEGAIPAMVEHQRQGTLYDTSDPDKLCQILKTYIDNPDLVKTHGLAARDHYANNYTLPIFTEELSNILRQCT